MITELIGLVLVAVVLVCIIWIMVRPSRPSSEKSGGSRVGAVFASSFLQGLLSAVALGAAVQSSSNQWLAGITAGAVVGALFAMTTGTGGFRPLVVNVMTLLFGSVGLVVTVTSYVVPVGSCTPADLGERVLGFLLVLVALVIGGVLSVLRGFFSLATLGPTVLAVFGAVGIVEFLSSPLGVAVVDLGATGWIVALVAALAVGFAASIWPDLVIGVAGTTVALGSLIGAVSGSGSPACLPGPEFSALAPIIGFAAIFWVVRAVVGRLGFR